MISSTKEIVGMNVNYYRKKANLTQEELAGLAKTGQRIISKIENYTQNYSISTLERLCIELNIPMYKLFISNNGVDYRELLHDPLYSKGAIMLLYHYYMFMSTIENEEVSDGKYHTYGIALQHYDEVKMEDISTDKNFVQHLVDFCNRYQVSPYHFPDVIQDAMVEFKEKQPCNS